MQRHRFWFEIVMLATAIACAVAFLLAILGAATGAATGQAEPAQAAPQSSSSRRSLSQGPLSQGPLAQGSLAQTQTYEGMVTDSRCGAKHSPAIAKGASDCVRICVHGGAQFALIDGETVYVLDGDGDELKKVAGQRARVVGAANGNTINVSSVAASS